MLSSRDSARFAVAAVALLLAGCSQAGRDTAEKAPSAAPSAASGPSAAAPADGPVGISAAGVTTRIDEPAQSTEEQYAQACVTAKDWMAAKGGNPHDLVEPYLKEVQASTDTGPATFRKTWAELSTAQQSAVIVAVRAAADGGC
ncbi:MAG: lipoprotein LpqV [Mycobacterium sp.]